MNLFQTLNFLHMVYNILILLILMIVHDISALCMKLYISSLMFIARIIIYNHNITMLDNFLLYYIFLAITR